MTKSALELAIQTQLDIQSQLQAEIAGLEKENAGSKETPTSVLRFYNSALHKVIADTAAINSDIIKYESKFIPETKNKLENLHAKKKFIQEHLDSIEKVKTDTTFDGELTDDKAAHMIQVLKAEISRYDHMLEAGHKKLDKLRTDLRGLLEKNRHDRGAMARIVWQDEVTSEQGLMGKVPIRRQSITGFGNPHQMRVLQNMSRRYSESGGLFRARVQNLLKEGE